MVGATRWVALYGRNYKDNFPDFESCPNGLVERARAKESSSLAFTQAANFVNRPTWVDG